MRIDDDRVLPQQVLHLGQRVEHLDVRIEIGDPLDAPLVHQVAQQPRLHRGRQLEHAVAGRHLIPFVDRELLGPHQLKRLGGAVDLAVDVVDHQRPARAAGVVDPRTSAPAPAPRQVVAGHDRADMHRAEGSVGADLSRPAASTGRSVSEPRGVRGHRRGRRRPRSARSSGSSTSVTSGPDWRMRSTHWCPRTSGAAHRTAPSRAPRRRCAARSSHRSRHYGRLAR